MNEQEFWDSAFVARLRGLNIPGDISDETVSLVCADFADVALKERNYRASIRTKEQSINSGKSQEPVEGATIKVVAPGTKIPFTVGTGGAATGGSSVTANSGGAGYRPLRTAICRECGGENRNHTTWCLTGRLEEHGD